MATKRAGFVDSFHNSRLTHITGTVYPANPAGTFLALYAGSMPVSDGTGGTEVTGTRPAITLGAPQTDFNGRAYITHAAAVSSITLTNTSPAEVVGFGIFAANSGGTPIYVDRMPAPFQVAAGATISIPAGAVKLYAEPPSY